jgi:NAD(P)-dependent dehydrogenase (short-subunit alcohol dehydrogenase family)
MRLKDRVAIVTGGSQGIGEEIALAYGREGAKVAIVNRKSPGEAARVVERITSAGGVAAAFTADLSRVPEIDRVVGEIVRHFGTVDILVNNAGLFLPNPVEATDEAIWDSQLDLNLKGAFFLVKAVLPEMKRKGSGKIINISSIAGVGGFPNSAAYCASKGGLINLSKALCLELARFGINVNVLAPGNIATPINAHLRADPEWCAKMRAGTPTGQDFLPASDMAGTAVFLASDEARAVHGATIMVDAGWAAW